MNNMSYTASQYETYDLIALNLYGDSRYAYKLIEANPKYIHILRFNGGEVLTVPELDEADTASLPPWKR